MIAIKVIFGCISLLLSGVFGWFFIGKFRQSAFISKMLRDPALLTAFIRDIGIKKIETDASRIKRKGSSFRENLDDIVFVNAHASKSLKIIYGAIAVVGILSGMLIGKYVFMANLAILVAVAFLQMPVNIAYHAVSEINQMIVILYRLRQVEPFEYVKLLVDIPGLRSIGKAIDVVAKSEPSQGRAGGATR